MATFVENLFSIEGRIALVTGASSGIGKRMAVTLAKAGAQVILLARNEDTLLETKAEIEDAGGKAFVAQGDLKDIDAINGLYRKASAAFGSPDILVNAAGINPRQSAEDYTIEDWNATLAVNLSAPFFLARACVPGMKAKGCGNIINIASLQTFRAFTNGTAYGASKAGIGQLTRAMAEAWSPFGIVANAIAPGFFPTALTGPIFANAALAEHHARATAIGRNGELEDLDGATVLLASRAARYITGQILSVDGGYTAK